ncbi:MAG: DUF6036 family nucleotidyltransferase [Nitrosotalea sp.]
MSSEIDNSKLFDFLEELDKEVTRDIIIVAAGGTAMTLLQTKPSTIDVDFTIPGEDYGEFERVLKLVSHGFKVDTYKDGAVFSQILPADYINKSKIIKTKMKNITLKALSPLDIVITKIGRLNDRDKEDIKTCIRKFKITKDQVIERAKQVEYVGREENYEINLQYTLRNFFKQEGK